MDTQSAENFIKSLKASNDIELAISAWANENLYIPSKGQFLAAWALNTLLKNNNVVSDSRYWTLLESILLGNSSSPLWLPTLVLKTPVVPILTSILRNFAIENGNGFSKEMLEPCQRVLKMILPIAYPKTRLDTVLDCFWASLDLLSGTVSTENLMGLVNIGVDGFRAAFTKVTNKAKIYGSFVEGHFPSFVRAMLDTGRHFRTKELIWAAVRDIICSFDAIRAISQQLEVSNQSFFGILLQTCEFMPETVGLCPRLFVDQIAAARFHRSALSQINVELHSWQSYASFAFIFEKTGTEGALALLETLTEVETHIGSGIREQHWLNILNKTVLQCVQRLGLKETKNNDGLQSSLTASLVVLGRINYGLLESHIPEIVKTLAHLPSENISGGELYEAILSYHSKTRSMDSFSKQLFGVVLRLPANEEFLPPAADGGTVFAVMNSCLLGTVTGSVFSLALKQYITPGQILRIVSTAVSSLQEAWRPLKDIFVSYPPAIVSTHSEFCASRLALVFRLASFVLPALPVALTLQQELAGWRNTLCEEVAIPSLKLALDERCVENWAFQILASAILRFISSLEGGPLSFKALQTLDIAEIASLESLLLPTVELLGDLKLELTRVLLRESSTEKISVIVQNTLDYLGYTKSEVWNGRATAMATGSLNTGLTLLLTDRWLRTLESYATDEQLEQFVGLIVLSCKDAHLHPDQTSIHPGILAWRTLGNGLFWELRRLQGALLSAIIEGTEKADLVGSGLGGLVDQMQPPDRTSWPTTIQELGQYFHILLFFPFEVFKGENAATLARRALLTDQAASHSSDPLSFSTLAIRASCRLFASRCLQDPKSSFTDYIGDKRVIQFLVAAEPGFRSYPELDFPFFQATHAILDFAFSVFIRRAVQSESKIEDLLPLFSSLNSAPLSNAEPSYLDGLAHLLYSLAVWWHTADHSQEESVLAFLTYLQDTLQDFLCNSLLERSSLLPSVLRLLRACLRFRHIHPSSMNETIGNYILVSLSILQSPLESPRVSEDSLTELMGMLVDALELAPGDFDLATRMVTLHYLASSRHDINLDLSLQRGVKMLKTQAYEQSLRMAMEMLGTEASKSLVHALTVILVHCPEGTFRIAQSTLSESLDVLNDISASPKQKVDIELQREILHYVLCICTDKPAFIRVLDVGSILTLLASFLQPSVQTVPCTHTEIFHTIVKATTALVRNRRDLILLSLPHLAVVFCLLFRALTKPQPNLGQKQFGGISNRLPHWIVLSQPLGSPEASSLSRLLVTMTTKTIVRSTRMNQSSHELGKDAQSLAKPFGKHASCVVGAYINLLNDPLCLLDRETRMELVPGLLALCGMIGEKGRDALMPTLDAGGRVIFKELWSSYDTQKYVGKG